jgi:uncharacterized GH25 family protein
MSPFHLPLRLPRWFLLLAAAWMLAAPARAHDFWIEPSTFTPAPGPRIPVRLRVGQDWKGDPVPREGERIVRFTATSAAGAEVPIPGVEGTEPAGFAAFPKPGLYLLAYGSHRASVELPGAKFEEYLALEGLEAIHDLRAKRRQVGAPGREVFSRSAKAVVRVGKDIKDNNDLKDSVEAGFDRALGLELELIPEKNPLRVSAGGTLPLRLLFRGQPLAGAKVVAFRKEQPLQKAAVRTDKKGHAELPLAAPGTWLIKAVHMLPAPQEIRKDADWESFWASLTFQNR